MTTKNKIFIYVLIMVIVIIQAGTAFAQAGLAQVFGVRYSATGYWGVDARQTTPNPFIFSGWTAGPVAVTNLVGDWPAFIESGPTKACDDDCGLHPYITYGLDGSYYPTQIIRKDIWLGAEQIYRYRSNYIGNKKWKAVFCSGTGCITLGIANLEKNKLFYISAGGESEKARWGKIKTINAKFRPFQSSTWSPWCYTAIVNTGGTISACNASYYSWISGY